jgi:transposase-like protein
MCSSKKGVSSHQLMRTLETTYKTAWFMTHRIREAMRTGDLAPFGQGGGDVEVDETFIGFDPDEKVTGNWTAKMKVLSLVDRTTGRAKSVVVDDLKMGTIVPILAANISLEARLLTDEAPRYVSIGWNFAAHGHVNHGRDQYVHPQDRTIHTNTIEGYFSIFKRGMKGVYQHCGKKHLHRYLAEFDFRYSNRIAVGVDDLERASIALKGFAGRRLTYAA